MFLFPLPNRVFRVFILTSLLYSARGARHPLEKAHRKELRSRPWLTQLYEANLWINYNEGLNFSSSVIHYDMNHQMMCVYDGKKEWILWDSWNQMEHIPMWICCA